MGKGSSSAQSGKQTVVNELPSYARPYYENLMKRAEAESLKPYQAYQGQRLAESDKIADIAGSRNIVRNVVSQGVPELNMAIGGVGAMAAPGQYTGQMAQAYMSPYMQNVVDVQKKGAIQDFNRMGAQRGFEAAKAGAYGGSRHGVADYLAQEGLTDQLSEIQALGQQRAYEQGAQRYDVDRQVGIAGLKDMAGLVGQRRAADIQGAQLLEGIGKQQLAEQQAGLDIGYQDYLRQQGYTRDQLGFLSNALQGVPISPNATTTNYQSYNPLQQALGMGISALGLYRGMT